jgi:HEPN domain-containing protein
MVTEARNVLDEAQGHAQEARKALNDGDYYAALSAASAATQSAKAATEKLDTAPAATPRRRPGTS